jgi:hypothetical protein
MNGMATGNVGTKLTLVLGGTGKTGRRVVSRLEERGFGYAVIGLIPRWLAARRLGLQTVLAGSFSAGVVSITRKRLTVKSSISTSPRCTLRRSARKIDSRAMASAPMAKAPRASAPTAAVGMRTGGNSNSCRRKSRIVVMRTYLLSRAAGEGSRTTQLQIMPCSIREVAGANARPTRKPGPEADKQTGLMRLGSEVYQVENVRLGQKRTLSPRHSMSALPLEADIQTTGQHVC